MKFFIGVVLFLGSLAHAEMMPYNQSNSVCITAGSSGNAIPITFTTSAKSKILTHISATHLAVTYNGLASDVSFEISTSMDDSAPSTSSTHQLYLPAAALAVFDNILLNSALYLRSNTGSTITSGTLCVFTW